MRKEVQPAFDFTPVEHKRQEYAPESLRLQQEIEENLAAAGRHSLSARVFADQIKFWAEENSQERIDLMWDIWDNMVWTPGYAVTYADAHQVLGYRTYPGGALRLRENTWIRKNDPGE
jgi:hypothetical protein